MTYHIHLRGQVQGVGFRPFVYQAARAFGLPGWVSNTTDGVHLEVNGSPETVGRFYEHLLHQPPALARITGHSCVPVPDTFFDDFTIRHSESTGDAVALLTPDVALCAACAEEMRNPADRRHGYPFLTCTACGPRYSITRQLPYDREHTTMDAFPMCAACQREYDDPLDRRYYSQTNSCPACGVRLALYNAESTAPETDTRTVLRQAGEALLAGKVVAVKGIGGYLLLCDATDAAVIHGLRQRKGRPTKPLALLYPDLAVLEKDARVREVERQALLSPAAPVVLLPLRDDSASGVAWSAVAPGLRQVGAMLPYAPLFRWLADYAGQPLVATSANVSNAPIIHKDGKARAELFPLADLVLTHNREIVVPQDDSVVRFTAGEQPLTIRRSRGYAPTYIGPGLGLGAGNVLALGADLKSTFARQYGQNLYVSGYLGDLESYDTQGHYRHTLAHFTGLLSAKPDVLLADKHPGYFSTGLGHELARQWRVPVQLVQHHQAHFAAVLGENNLLHTTEPVLGVIWDGVGYGDDGQVWGGEFLVYHRYAFRRAFHLAPFPNLMCDKMAREPRLAALALCHSLSEAQALLREKFTPTEWAVYGKRLQTPPTLRSTSMGRVFDAVASLLGLADHSSYEGEAAMRLEAQAGSYLRRKAGLPDEPYAAEAPEGESIAVLPIVKKVIQGIRAGKPVDEIAAAFHLQMAQLVVRVAQAALVRKIAFSGGVFQNAVLVDLLTETAGRDYDLYFHRQLSPNDECIALGQLMVHEIERHVNEKAHVFSNSRENPVH
jgi:hydrogenase maturation protein HypF